MTDVIEIVDAQVHLNQIMPDWRSAPIDSAIATGIQAMDAVGVHAVLIAESRGFDSKMRPALGPELPNGAIRAQFPFSARAVELHPNRFAYLVRIDIKDPELERIVSEVRQKPGALCMRIVPVPNIGEVASLERGEFEPHHYAFRIGDSEFDQIFARVKAEGIAYGSGPRSRTDMQINRRNGGRGFYFDDPNGHILEVLTA